MKLVTKCFFLALCIALPVWGQTVATNNFQYAGCYEVRTLNTTPSGDSTKLIPSQFELTTNRSHFNNRSFVLKPLGESVDTHGLQLFSWTPNKNRLHLEFSNGKSGYYGNLKPTGTDEFIGNLKYFCDWLGHCGRHDVAITVHKTGCLQ